MPRAKRPRQNPAREHLAYLAARLMAEDGIQDYGAAKRKAARQAGMSERDNLPANQEIEAALRSYQSLYQSDEQPIILRRLREVALEAMEVLTPFQPHLVGSVLSGTAGVHSDVNLQLYPDSQKDVEIFLLNRDIAFTTSSRRAWLGDRQVEVPLLIIQRDGIDITLALFGLDDMRVAQKHRGDRRPVERAKLAEVKALLDSETAGATEQARSPSP